MNNEIEIDESYDFLLSKQSKEKSKVSIKNIKIACDKLLSLKALITVTTVGKFIADIDNELLFESFNNSIPPMAQSISNNKDFKTFVELYKNLTPKKSSESHKDSGFVYPSAGLDIKTKAYIDVLRHSHERLIKENKDLSAKFTSETMRNPVSLLGSEEQGPVNNNEMVLAKSTENYPFSMSDLVSIIQKIPLMAESFPNLFRIDERGEKQVMTITTPSKEERIFNSKDMEIITSCSNNLGSK